MAAAVHYDLAMRAVVQRVTRAKVTSNGGILASIGAGLCILVGAGPDDSTEVTRHLARRVAGLRVFADEAGKMNLDARAVGAEILVVSQFTLYADTSRGHRPSFTRAAAPELASQLCDEFAVALADLGLRVATGRFGDHMQVDLVNDGPVTIVLSSGEPPWSA